MNPMPASSMMMLAVTTWETLMLIGVAPTPRAISVATPPPTTCW